MQKYPLIFLFAALLIAGCHPQIKSPARVSPHFADGQYDSEFPSSPTSPYLDKIIKSVKMVSILTFYKAYEFNLKDSVTIDRIKNGSYKSKVIQETIYEQPSAGTATAILQSGKEILFLTCAHVVMRKDTSIMYYASGYDPQKPSEYIYSFAKKMRQISSIISIPRASQPKVIAYDKEKDLALISVTLTERPHLPFPVFKYPIGKASQLHWGTFVYLIGYPNGKLLISSSVVSAPNRDDQHNFLINATVERGISGGIVLALRDGAPNFELVGLANALNAQIQYYLKPEFKARETYIDMEHPYSGKIYLGQRLSGGSNIVFSISAESISKFIRKNLSKIEEEGFRYPPGFPQNIF